MFDVGMTIRLAAMAAVLATPVGAAGSAAQDWPCAERVVPELNAGMMWEGPELADDAPDWQSDAAVADLVEHLAVRRTSMKAARARIESFARELPPDEKAPKLTLVFHGLLETVNAERKDILRGIARFSREQQQLSDDILQARRELEEALATDAPTPSDDQRRRGLEQTLARQTRIHENRDRSLAFVCEIPMLVDRRLSALARELAAHID